MVPRSTRTRAATPVPARSAPTGIVAFCAGLVLAALALLMLDVTRGGLTVPAALALLDVLLAGSLVVALIFGRGKIRVPSLLWEVLPF